jgi:hypothetical protein
MDIDKWYFFYYVREQTNAENAGPWTLTGRSDHAYVIDGSDWSLNFSEIFAETGPLGVDDPNVEVGVAGGGPINKTFSGKIVDFVLYRFCDTTNVQDYLYMIGQKLELKALFFFFDTYTQYIHNRAIPEFWLPKMIFGSSEEDTNNDPTFEPVEKVALFTAF